MEALESGELVRLLQDGDLEALGVLYDRYHQLVFRTAYAITGDPDAAADLLQDVFLRVYRYIGRVDPTRPLEPWLYRVTTNLSLSWISRRRWMRPIEEVADWLVGDRRGSIQRHIEQAEETRRLELAIATLPAAQRVVVVLYYINDLSLNEIADVLEIPAGTVKSRLHYGRKALKEKLSSRGDLLPEAQYEFT